MEYRLNTKFDYGETRAAIENTFRLWSNLIGQPITPQLEVNSRRFLAELPDPNERRVTLKWTHPTAGPKTMACDRFLRIADNARAIFMCVEDLRKGELRMGAEPYNDLMRQAVGLLSVPVSARDPYEVLGIRPDASLGLAEAAYKELSREAMRSANAGAPEQQKALNLAIADLRGKLK